MADHPPSDGKPIGRMEDGLDNGDPSEAIAATYQLFIPYKGNVQCCVWIYKREEEEEEECLLHLQSSPVTHTPK